MKKLIVLAALAFFATTAFSQSNLFSAGVCHTAAAPNFNPGLKGCRLVLDTTSQTFYVWKIGTVWVALGRGVDEISGCSAPAYTPNKWQSSVVINHCTPNPELYYYFSGTWKLAGGAGGGATYTAGTGINISAGNVISNTGDLSSTNELQNLSLVGQALSISGGTGVTLPVVGVTAADFDLASGVLLLDYTNAQKATAVVPGFLTAADWAAFNAKLSTEVDGSVSNEINTSLGVVGANLALVDAGGTLTVPVVNIAPVQSLISGTGINITGTSAKTINSTITQYADENAQDAVGAMAGQTLTYVDATPLLDVKTQMSITSDASGVKLSGDAASPGNTQLYGTNGSGVKGWYAQPAGGGGGSVTAASEGVSLFGTTVQLGNAVGLSTANFTTDRDIPLNSNILNVKGVTKSVKYIGSNANNYVQISPDSLLGQLDFKYPSSSAATEKIFLRVDPPTKNSSQSPFYMGISNSTQTGQDGNNVMMMGWNLAPGGGKVEAGKPYIGESWEYNFRIGAPGGYPRYLEKHEIYMPSYSTTQRRLSSYTIIENAGIPNVIGLYHTVNSLSLRDTTGQDYISMRGDASLYGAQLTLNGPGGNTSFAYDASGASAIFNFTNTKTANNPQFVLAGFKNFNFSASTANNVMSFGSPQFQFTGGYMQFQASQHQWTTTGTNPTRINSGGFNCIENWNNGTIYGVNIGANAFERVSDCRLTVTGRDATSATHSAQFYPNNLSTPILDIRDDGRVGVNTSAPAYTLDVIATDAIRIPSGTTAQAPTGAVGVIRHDLTTGKFTGVPTGTAYKNFLMEGDVVSSLWTDGGATTYLTATGDNVAIGLTSATAVLHIKAGTATANTAPVKLTSGPLLTVTEPGAVGYNNSLYFTKNSGLRFGIGGIIFKSSATVPNVTTTETDLYSHTLPASALATDNESVEAAFSVSTLGSATATTQNRLYFGGTLIYDSGAIGFSIASDFRYTVEIIRESATVVKVSVTGATTGATAAAYTVYTRITGLTLSNTQILRITGTRSGVGSASGDINGTMSTVKWFPAAG